MRPKSGLKFPRPFKLGIKTGESREKTLGAPSSRTWLISHVPRVWARTNDKHCGEMIELSAFIKSAHLTTAEGGGGEGILFF